MKEDLPKPPNDRTLNVIKFHADIKGMGYEFDYEDLSSFNFKKVICNDEEIMLKMIKLKGVTFINTLVKYRKKLPKMFDNLEINKIIACDEERAIEKLKQFEMNALFVGSKFIVCDDV